MHSHVEYLAEPAALAVIRVYPEALSEYIEDDEGNRKTGEKTGLMSITVTTDVPGRDGMPLTLTAFTIPVKLLRDLEQGLPEIDDLEQLASSLEALTQRMRTTINMMAAMQQ